MTPEQCEEAKRRIHDQIASENPGEPFSVGSEGDDALRLSNVFNKQNPDGLFDAPVTHPRVLACMRLMLGDSFKLSSLNFRGANPGSGLQGLHTGARTVLPLSGCLLDLKERLLLRRLGRESAGARPPRARRVPAGLQLNLAVGRIHAQQRRDQSSSWLPPDGAYDRGAG